MNRSSTVTKFVNVKLGLNVQVGGRWASLTKTPTLDTELCGYLNGISSGFALFTKTKSTFRERKIIIFEIITCDPWIYTRDHPDLTVSNFMGNSFGQTNTVADWRLSYLPHGCFTGWIRDSPEFFKKHKFMETRGPEGPEALTWSP